MKLFSYFYLTKNFHTTNYITLGLILLIGVTILVSGLGYLKHRSNLKFRSLFILFILFGALIISSEIEQFSQQKNYDSNTNQTVELLKDISKEKHVPLKNMYTDSTNLTDGMTVKAGHKYYRVHFNNNLTSYTLSPTNLITEHPTYISSNKLDLSTFVSKYGEITMKLLVGLIMIVIQINISGKGNLAPTNALDQLQNYVLGGIVGGVIYNNDISVIEFVIILLIWSIIVFGIKFLTGQVPLLDALINGKPEVIIRNGNINVTKALEMGLDADDLHFKLRTDGINNYKDVKNATLEQNGQLTIEGPHDTLDYPVITDGNIHEDVLKKSKISKEQFEEMLKKQHVKLKDVYLGQLVHGKLELVKYPK